MRNTKSSLKFNESNFSALLAWHIDSNNKIKSIESVLNVLRQSSDGSRLGKLNHNCRVSGIPFTWDYYTGYGEDRNQIKVLTFPMCKISTGWNFYLDVEESGCIYLSEGFGTRRTSCKYSILNAFAPSTLASIADTIDFLCGRDRSKKEIFFDIYRRFGGSGDLCYTKFDHNTESLYNAYSFDNDYVYLEYMQKFESADAYEEIKKSNILKKIVVVKWEKDYDCWYCDFLVDNSAWHIDCLTDVGSYPVNKDSKTYEGDENLPKYAQDWLIKAIKSIPYGDWKTGSYFCYESDNGEWKSTRIWSEIPEDKRVNLFISTDKDCRYFYNDIREIDLSPEDNPTSEVCMRFGNGRAIFKYDHDGCESRNMVKSGEKSLMEEMLGMNDESDEDED